MDHSETMVAKCVRIYKSGDFKLSTWEGEDLARWIEYNTTFRPGCAVIVDGTVLQEGYLTPHEIQEKMDVIGLIDDPRFVTNALIFDS